MYSGFAIGGPAHGQLLHCSTPTLYVPIMTDIETVFDETYDVKEPMGFKVATYRWSARASMWICEDLLK